MQNLTKFLLKNVPIHRDLLTLTFVRWNRIALGFGEEHLLLAILIRLFFGKRYTEQRRKKIQSAGLVIAVEQ